MQDNGIIEIYDIAAEIIEERLNQIAKWGQQDHPSSFSESTRVMYGHEANHWKRVNDARVDLDCLTWDGILLEEVFEALAEKDDAKRREELVQVAAVAAAEIEAIDRRASEREAA